MVSSASEKIAAEPVRNQATNFTAIRTTPAASESTAARRSTAGTSPWLSDAAMGNGSRRDPRGTLSTCRERSENGAMPRRDTGRSGKGSRRIQGSSGIEGSSGSKGSTGSKRDRQSTGSEQNAGSKKSTGSEKSTGSKRGRGGEPGIAGELRELYALPPGEFTAARKRLAARLKQEGRGAEAERVADLARPSASVWAVNQLLREESRRVADLLAAGERARAAQQQVLSGKLDAGALQRSAREVRKLVDELGRRAAELAAAAGTRVGALTGERIAADLEAMALDPAGVEAVAGGWLEQDLDRPGLNVLAGARLPAGAKRALEAGGGAVAAAKAAPEGKAAAGGGGRAGSGTWPGSQGWAGR